MEKQYVTAREIARLLGLHPRTVIRMARRGQIPALKNGRYFRFWPEAVREALEKGR